MILAINSTYAADDFIYKPGISNYEEDINRVLNINKDSTIPTEYENIDIELAPPIANDRYTVSVNDGCNLKVNGSTQINLHAYMPDQQDDDSGSHALFAVGISGSESEDPKISKIDLLGDVALILFLKKILVKQLVPMVFMQENLQKLILALSAQLQKFRLSH